MNPNDEVIAYGRENNVGDQYNDIMLTTLQDTYDSSASLTDLYGKAWLSGLRDGNTLTLPTLHLPFARLKQLDSRITFTRASNATYFDAAGVMQTAAEGVARFDHNPSTGESLGLLIEEARTNLLTYSEQFDHANWAKTRTSVSGGAINATVAPDGTTTADKIIEDATASSTHLVQAYMTVAANTVLTFSVYAKASTKSYLYLQLTPDGTNEIGCGFNLSSGLAGTPENAGNGSGATAIIVPLQNGWYRCSLSGISSATVANPAAKIMLATGSTEASTVYTGDGTSGLYIWGAQLEAGAFPTSYIKTEATALTRAADLASMTGTNFSSWYNQSEGSLVLVGSRASVQASEAFMAFSDLTTSEAIVLQGGSATPGQMRLDVSDGGVAQAQIILYTDSTYQTKHNIAFAYALNDFASSADGSAIVTDTSGTLPTATALTIGRRGSGGYVINGHISRLTYYPKRLTNTALQVLSA